VRITETAIVEYAARGGRARRRANFLFANEDHVINRLAPNKAADRWPVHAALVPEHLWIASIGNLIMTRRMPNGRLACGVFLVDVFCLGVKDSLWKLLTPAEFNELRKHTEEHGRLNDVPPESERQACVRAEVELPEAQC
jgi:hypothetical protein